MLGGFQSGQMGRTVNPLLRFRRFESFSPHHLILDLRITIYDPVVNLKSQIVSQKAEVAQLVER